MESPTIEQIIHYVNKDDLLLFLGHRYDKFITANNLPRRNNVRELKGALCLNEELCNEFKQSDAFRRGCERLQTLKQRMQNPVTHDKAKKTLDIIRKAKAQFLGCLATRLTTEDYEWALQNFNDPYIDYSTIKIFPKDQVQYKLYEQAAERNDERLANLLVQPRLQRDSVLPKSLRKFMLNNPQKFSLVAK